MPSARPVVVTRRTGEHNRRRAEPGKRKKIREPPIPRKKKIMRTEHYESLRVREPANLVATLTNGLGVLMVRAIVWHRGIASNVTIEAEGDYAEWTREELAAEAINLLAN